MEKQKKLSFLLYHGSKLAPNDSDLLQIINKPRTYYKSTCKDPFKGIWCSLVPQVAVAYASNSEKGDYVGTILQVRVFDNSLFVEKKQEQLKASDIQQINWPIDGKGVYAGKQGNGSNHLEFLVKLGEDIQLKVDPNLRVIIKEKAGKPQIEKI